MVTLPYVKNCDSSFVEIPVDLPLNLHENSDKSKAKVKSAPPRRLPRNAGTASIVERQMRDLERIESPPPFIEAEVVVC